MSADDTGFFAFERLVLKRTFPSEGNVYQLPQLQAGTPVMFVRRQRRALLGAVNVVSVHTPVFDGWLLLTDDMLESTERGVS